MATYEYTARTADGEEVVGVMQADSDLAVARTLDERRLFPVRVEPKTAGRVGGRRSRKVRIRDVSVLYGQLSALLSAGVPMLRALKTLVAQSRARN